MTNKTETTEKQSLNESVLDGLDSRERELYRRIPDEVEYIDHSSFSAAGTEEQLFGEEAKTVKVPRWTHFSEVPEESEKPKRGRGSLSAKDEALLFLR